MARYTLEYNSFERTGYMARYTLITILFITNWSFGKHLRTILLNELALWQYIHWSTILFNKLAIWQYIH